jgi:DNA topoisomerase IB
MVQVADYLGNTPTVARGSYVDPRVIDHFEEGVTIAPTLQRLGRQRRRDPERARDAIERAVLRMLRG